MKKSQALGNLGFEKCVLHCIVPEFAATFVNIHPLQCDQNDGETLFYSRISARMNQ